MARRPGTTRLYAVAAAATCWGCVSQCDDSEKQRSTRSALSTASASQAATAPVSAEPPVPSASQRAPRQAPDRARATELGDDPPGVLAKLKAAEAIKSCSLDRVGKSAPEAAEIQRGAAAIFQGWAADSKRQAVPPTLVVILEGEEASYYAAGGRGPKRPDVAKMFKNEAFVEAGYKAVIDFTNVAPGEYRVKIFQVSWDEEATLCDTKKAVTVR